jgi:hypothetical protein
MASNRIFIPQDALETWLADGSAEMYGLDVVLKDEQKTFRISEGVRVVREVSGGVDTNDLVGKCKSRMYLKQLGAEILEHSMVLENNAYDVVPGFLGVPVGATNSQELPAVENLTTDERLLADFLSKKM